MLKEEDIILHGSTIADSEGLLHGKYKSKHKSKSGKWVYVYEDAKKAVGGLFDKDVDRTVIGVGQAEYTNRTAEKKRGALMNSHNLALKDANRLASKSNKKADSVIIVLQFVSLRISKFLSRGVAASTGIYTAPVLRTAIIATIK